MSSPTKVRETRIPRKLKLTLAVFSTLVLVVWFFGNGWVAARFEGALTGGLNRQGLDLTWKSSSWDPWRGLHLTDLRLVRYDGDWAPVAEMDHLNLTLPLAQAFSKEHRITRWKVSGSDVTLHDSDGAVKLENVSVNLEASSGNIEIKQFKFGGRSLTADVNGSIDFKPAATPDTKPPELRWGVVRAILSTLDFKQENDSFHVTGHFAVNLADGRTTWKTNLRGEGQQLDWKGVKWKSGTAQAMLSSENSSIEYDLHTANGSTRGQISREDWKNSPFLFKGEVRDKADRVDSYQGNYQNRILTLEHLTGQADLIALSRDVHALDVKVPENLKFQTFPMVELKNLVRDSSGEVPVWKVASLEIVAKDKVSFTLDGREAEAHGVTVHAANDGKNWVIRDSKAEIFSGTLSVEGRLRDKSLQQSRVDFKGINLGELKRFGGGSAKSRPGLLSGSYRGQLYFASMRAEGSGSIRLDDAPILEVPLLDEVYDLFNTLLPGVKRSDKGRFEANFKADGSVVDVTRFEATGGTLTVSAVGKVYLDKRTVSGRARGKLTGLPGLVTSPLSRLLEMDVGGPYNKIRVKPLGPAKLASNTASGTVGVVVDTLEETGKITGTVLTEGVKLPFRLFDKDKEEKKKD